MRGIVLTFMFICSFSLYANVIPLSRQYTGTVDSYFRRGDDVFSLSGLTTNGHINRYDETYPYAGGMVLSSLVNMSPDSIAFGTQFLRSYTATSGYAECWGSGYLEGTLTIGETLQYPSGTPLELKIDYAAVVTGNTSSFPHSRGVVLTDQNYLVLWEAAYLTETVFESHFLQVTSGTTYHFYMWQDFGNSREPVIPKTLYTGGVVAVDFSVIPEPCTVLLLGLGGLLIRKQ